MFVPTLPLKLSFGFHLCRFLYAIKSAPYSRKEAGRLEFAYAR